LPSKYKERYEAYISSPEWKLKRAEYKASRPWSCFVCSETKKLHLHHITYRRMGCELLDDLIPLCSDCHAATHRMVAAGGSRRNAHRLLRAGTTPEPRKKKEKKPKKPKKRVQKRIRVGDQSPRVRTPKGRVFCKACSRQYEDGMSRLRCECGSLLSLDPGVISEARIEKRDAHTAARKAAMWARHQRKCSAPAA